MFSLSGLNRLQPTPRRDAAYGELGARSDERSKSDPQGLIAEPSSTQTSPPAPSRLEVNARRHHLR